MKSKLAIFTVMFLVLLHTFRRYLPFCLIRKVFLISFIKIRAFICPVVDRLKCVDYIRNWTRTCILYPV